MRVTLALLALSIFAGPTLAIRAADDAALLDEHGVAPTAEGTIAYLHALKPDAACFVPEKREEVTTEGGLNLLDAPPSLGEMVATLKDADISVTAFVDPSLDQIQQAARLQFDAVEIHTGAYANATRPRLEQELKKIKEAATAARHLGLRVHAGHGLNYHNVRAMLEVPHLEELNIGHSIISRAVFTGMDRAVRDMLTLLGRP